MVSTGGWQGPLYHKAVVRKGNYGGARGLCWVPCLFESETSSSTSLDVVSWIGAKGKQKNETCGARCGPGLLWSSCSEALHRRKGNKGGSRGAQQIETIAGSGSFTHTHGRTTRWKQHSFHQLSGCSRGPGTRCAMCADRTAAVDCAAGMPGRTPGGRRIEVMRAVASSAD
jgi:hypothetical protein